MSMIRGMLLALLMFTFAGVGTPARAAETASPTARDLPPGLVIPPEALPGPGFDVDRATQAYIDMLSPEQRAQSDAYFEGGYWLDLWQTLYGLGVAALVLLSGWARRLRDLAQRLSRFRWLSTAIFVAMFTVVYFVLNLPMAIYADFYREHQYALSTQTFGAWLGDGVKGLIVSMILAPPIVATIYGAVRRASERWWIWASGIVFVFALFSAMIAPVFISPLFNEYKPLAQGELRDSLLSLARANRIPATDVYQFDASRQTTRISANVSGMFHTTRVSLNDNLLNKTSEPEIRAVMGHEMGHYVLNHGIRLTVYLTLVFTFAFLFLHYAMGWSLTRWGERLGIRERADPAGLPLVAALLSIFMLFATPLTRSIVRQAEAEADMFGLDAAREPHGFAMAAMRLSTYRKIHPGPLEEVIFYDHPSGYDRVHRSMQWLAENQNDPKVLAAIAQARQTVATP